MNNYGLFERIVRRKSLLSINKTLQSCIRTNDKAHGTMSFGQMSPKRCFAIMHSIVVEGWGFGPILQQVKHELLCKPKYSTVSHKAICLFNMSCVVFKWFKDLLRTGWILYYVQIYMQLLLTEERNIFYKCLFWAFIYSSKPPGQQTEDLVCV